MKKSLTIAAVAVALIAIITGGWYLRSRSTAPTTQPPTAGEAPRVASPSNISKSPAILLQLVEANSKCDWLLYHAELAKWRKLATTEECPESVVYDSAAKLGYFSNKTSVFIINPKASEPVTLLSNLPVEKTFENELILSGKSGKLRLLAIVALDESAVVREGNKLLYNFGGKLIDASKMTYDPEVAKFVAAVWDWNSDARKWEQVEAVATEAMREGGPSIEDALGSYRADKKQGATQLLNAPTQIFPSYADDNGERSGMSPETRQKVLEALRKASGNSGLQFFLYFNGLNGNNLITAYDEAIEGEPMLMAKPVLKCKNPCDSFEVILPAIPTSGDPTAYVQNNVVALDVHSGFALMDDNKKTCIYSGQSDKLVTLGESAKHVGWLPATDLWEAARDYSR